MALGFHVESQYGLNQIGLNSSYCQETEDCMIDA